MNWLEIGMTNINFKLIGGAIDGMNLGIYDDDRLLRQLTYPFPVRGSAVMSELERGKYLDAHENSLRHRLKDHPLNPSELPFGLGEQMILRVVAHATIEKDFPKDLRSNKLFNLLHPKAQEDALYQFVSVQDEENIFFVIDHDEDELLTCVEIDPVKLKSYRLVNLNRKQVSLTEWEVLNTLKDENKVPHD